MVQWLNNYITRCAIILELPVIIYIRVMEDAEEDVASIGHYTLGRTIGRGGFAKVRGSCCIT